MAYSDVDLTRQVAQPLENQTPIIVSFWVKTFFYGPLSAEAQSLGPM